MPPEITRKPRMKKTEDSENPDTEVKWRTLNFNSFRTYALYALGKITQRKT